jgi:signal transduction histidine kinase
VRDENDLARIAELEAAITEAKRIADAAAAERAELLGKITEQVRAPLSSAVGTVDTMLEERFGPIGNERYRAYLSDIRGSGTRILSLFEDLASLSKADSVKLETKATPAPKLPGVNLNDVVKASVAKMQPEASRVRVLIRTSLSSISLPVTAEADSLNNIVVNLLTSSIRFAGTGGQVIVSTAPGGAGKVTLRLRDTGAGLSDKELAELQLPANAAKMPGAAEAADEKLTMAITRAMLDANNATLAVTSKAEDGTLVEVTFPAAAA